MFHFASYANTEFHIGSLIACDRKAPPDLVVDQIPAIADLVKPSHKLTKWWDDQINLAAQLGWGFPDADQVDTFRRGYLEELALISESLLDFINGHDLANEDITFVSAEDPFSISPRLILKEVLEKHRPESVGLSDEDPDDENLPLKPNTILAILSSADSRSPPSIDLFAMSHPTRPIIFRKIPTAN